MRRIQYGVNGEGMFVSRVGSQVAWPILAYDKIGEGGDFTRPLEYYLDVLDVLEVGPEWSGIRWTRKIPLEAKEMHREFWGFPPLRAKEGV